MTDSQPPYVPANPIVPVTVTVDDEHWPGRVIGWRGEQVDVTWTTGIGATHIGFVDAAQVERVA